jgi:hypothetical protein
VLGTSAIRLAAQNASQDNRPVVAVLDYINASMRHRRGLQVASPRGNCDRARGASGRNGQHSASFTREKLKRDHERAEPGHEWVASTRARRVQVERKLLNAHHIIYGTYLRAA